MPAIAQTEKTDWNGFSVGALGSYTTGVTEKHISLNMGGAMAGLLAGYDHQFDAPFIDWPIVLGAKAMATALRPFGKQQETVHVSRLTGTETDRLQLDEVGTLGGRLGVPLFDRYLVYVGGGLAYGSGADVSSVSGPLIPPQASRKVSFAGPGWYAAIGGEMSVWGPVNLGVEIRRIEISNKNTTFAENFPESRLQVLSLFAAAGIPSFPLIHDRFLSTPPRHSTKTGFSFLICSTRARKPALVDLMQRDNE